MDVPANFINEFAFNMSFERNRAPLEGQNRFVAIVERTTHAAGRAIQAVAAMFVKGATIIAAGTVYVVSAIAACPIYLLGAVIKFFGNRTLETYTINLSQEEIDDPDHEGGHTFVLNLAPLNAVVKTEREIKCLHVVVAHENDNEQVPSLGDLATTLNKLGRNVKSVRFDGCNLSNLGLDAENIGGSELRYRWIPRVVENDNITSVVLERKEVVESLTLYVDANTEFYSETACLINVAQRAEIQTVKFVFIGDANLVNISDVRGMIRVEHMEISSHKDGVMKERTVNKLKKTMAKDLAELARRYPAPQADQPAVQQDENNNAGEDN